MEFTKEQQAAIERSGKNILVSAGAGSGKTEVLKQRVTHFIKQENGPKLSQFLILTFTNLAAAEMKDRIRKALIDINSPEASEVDSADISTFDAYALSLVKKYHFLLKVSPNVSNIDSTIIDVRKRTIINELFEEYYKANDKRFISMIDGLCFKDDSDIKKMVLKVYNKALLELDTEAYLKDFVSRYYSDNLINEIIESIEKKLVDKKNKLLSMIPNLSSKIVAKSNYSYAEKAKEIFQNFDSKNTYDEVVEAFLGITETLSKLGLPKSSKNLDEIESETLADFHKAYEKLATEIKSLPDNVSDFKDSLLATKPFAEVIVEILFKLDEKINQYKAEKNAFEFQDIAKMALNLVKNHEEVREPIKNNLKMIMVDEYQDTSTLQDTFISYIANNNVYMVGDVKQSIYRFRNADVSIFIDKYDSYKQNDQESVIDMNTNFRSRPEILSGINYMFKQIMTSKYGGADYKASHLIEAGNKDYDKVGKNPGQSPVSYLLYQEGVNDKDFLVEEAHVIARDIINKINSHFQVMDYEKDSDGKAIKDEKGNRIPYLRDCTFRDFCILMDRGGAFEKYSKVFSEYHLPLYVENDDDVTTNDMVLVMTNVLRLIKCIKNHDYKSSTFEKALASVARSYIYGYKDKDLYEMFEKRNKWNEEQRALKKKDPQYQEPLESPLEEEPIVKDFKEIIFNNFDSSIYEIFEKICFKLHFYEKCVTLGDVESNEKYLDFFLEKFKTMSDLDYSIDDFIIFMESVGEYNLKLKLSSQGSSLESVTIMNYHKSKGLEFNIVYYSGLKKQFNRMELKENFGFSSKYGLITPSLTLGKKSVIKELDNDNEVEEDTSEKIRQFYVALTRAREQAIILMSAGDAEGKEYSNCMNQFISDQVESVTSLHNPEDTSEQEAYEAVFGAFRSNKINRFAFERLLDIYNLDIPAEFRKDEILMEHADYETYRVFLETNEEYLKTIEGIIHSIEESHIIYHHIPQVVYDKLRNQEISFEVFAEVLDRKGFELTDKFYDDLNAEEDGYPTQESLDSHALFNPEWATKYPYSVYEEIEDEENYHEFFLSLMLLYLKKKITLSDIDTIASLLDREIEADFHDYLIEDVWKDYNGNLDQWEESLDKKYLLEKHEPLIEGENENQNIIAAIGKALEDKTINEDAISDIFFEVFEDLPFRKEIKNASLMYRDVLVIKDIFQEFINLIGYNLDDTTFNALCDEVSVLTDEGIEKYFEPVMFKSRFSINKKVFDALSKDESFPCESFLLEEYKQYKDGVVDYAHMCEMISCFGYEPTIVLIKEDEDKKKSHNDKDIDIIFEEKGELQEDMTWMVSFKGIASLFIGYRKFKKYAVDAFIKNPSLANPPEEVEHAKLKIEPNKVTAKTIEVWHPSKKLDLGVNKEALDFGTRMHFLMEVTDFKNPDYSSLKENEAITVKKFLESDIMKDVHNGEAYKEYEFFDEETSASGIIDLMMVYSDHIDIIDYKTKKIEDESYDKQVLAYMDVAAKLFGRPVKGYLYSLAEGTYREVTNLGSKEVEAER